MILYLDTSALVKFYIKETFSDKVISSIANAEAVATHVIAFVETQATFARLLREGKLTLEQKNVIKENFIKDWENYLQLETPLTLLHHAAKLAETFALRPYDSVHLAAAHFLFKQVKQPIIFACFDHKLNQAADVLGLTLLITHS